MKFLKKLLNLNTCHGRKITDFPKIQKMTFTIYIQASSCKKAKNLMKNKKVIKFFANSSLILKSTAFEKMVKTVKLNRHGRKIIDFSKKWLYNRYSSSFMPNS